MVAHNLGIKQRDGRKYTPPPHSLFVKLTGMISLDFKHILATGNFLCHPLQYYINFCWAPHPLAMCSPRQTSEVYSTIGSLRICLHKTDKYRDYTGCTVVQCNIRLRTCQIGAELEKISKSFITWLHANHCWSYKKDLHDSFFNNISCIRHEKDWLNK